VCIFLATWLQTSNSCNIRSLIQDYCSLFNSLHFFIYSLGSKVKLSWKLTSITKSDGKGYVLEYETPEEVVSVQAKSVIMTIPSYVASNILRPLSVSIN
jgi:L-2-hydroxyglutarate oxidase LhgO